MASLFRFKDKVYIQSDTFKNTYIPRVLLADLDGDGVNDLVYSRVNRSSQSGFHEIYPNGVGYDGDATKFIVAVQLLLSGSGKLVSSSNKLVRDPGTLTSAGIDVGEFNGDGIPDFVVGSYGMDIGMPVPTMHGWHTHVYLSNRTTGEWTASRLAPELQNLSDLLLTHTLAVGDLNADGLDDIYLNARNKGDRIYFSRGDGTFFSKTTFELYQESDTRTLGALITDLDSDGKEELIRFVSNDGDRGFPGDGRWLNKTGNLENQVVYSPANSPRIDYLPVGQFGETSTLSLGALTIDVNRDGIKDLVVNQTRAGANVYLGSKFQILINDGNGGWKDESFRVQKLPTEELVDFWYVETVASDFDMDGDMDIFAYEVTQGTYLYENVDGYFVNRTNEVLGALNPAVNGIYPIDWGDRVELVSIPSRISKTSNYDGEVSIFTSEAISRRKTADGKFVAYDLDANAGKAVKVLGAVAGKQSLGNKEYVGIGIDLLDKGMSYSDLAALALQAIGLRTNDQIVTALWTNVVGAAPTAADKAPFLSMLENGFSQGELARLAAETSQNASNIDLVGLARTGVEYFPVA